MENQKQNQINEIEPNLGMDEIELKQINKFIIRNSKIIGYIFFSGFFIAILNAITQKVTLKKLIPAEINENKSSVENKDIERFYDYEPDEKDILDELLPQNITTQIYSALLESSAAELAARMTAMDNATRNAGDMIDNLTLVYNRTRQANITKELIEIISGAEAL